MKNENDNGIFWMEFEAFVTYFSSIDICETNFNLIEKRISGNFDFNAKNNFVFRIIVYEESDFHINLFQDINNRLKYDRIDFWFLILTINNDKIDKIIFESARLIINKANVAIRLWPNNYLLVPMSFKYFQEENKKIKYNIALHSTKHFDIVKEMCDSALLSNIIIKMSQSNNIIKEIKDKEGNAIIYKINNYKDNVTIFTVKNLNVKKNLAIKMNIIPNIFRSKLQKISNKLLLDDEIIIEKSQEIKSSRKILESRDFIRPLKQQIIAILVHSNEIDINQICLIKNINREDYQVSDIKIDSTINFKIEYTLKISNESNLIIESEKNLVLHSQMNID